jgi:hypothetical protein
MPAKARGSATRALRACGGALRHSRSVACSGAARAACSPRLQRNAAERPCVHGRRPLRHVLVLKAGCGVCPVGQRVGAVHLQASTSPGADVARASRVPVQMWHGRAQSRCRRGTLESSPDADVANECRDGAHPLHISPCHICTRAAHASDVRARGVRLCACLHGAHQPEHLDVELPQQLAQLGGALVLAVLDALPAPGALLRGLARVCKPNDAKRSVIARSVVVASMAARARAAVSALQ